MCLVENALGGDPIDPGEPTDNNDDGDVTDDDGDSKTLFFLFFFFFFIINELSHDGEKTFC
jgi:hypothetical protein